MRNILLIQPPVRDFYLTRKRTFPYGLVSIAASLIREGFTVHIFDALSGKKSKPVPLPEEMMFLQSIYGSRADVSPFSLFHTFRHFGYSFETIGKNTLDIHPFLVGISSLFTAYSREALQTAKTVKTRLPDCKIVMGGHHPSAFPAHVLECEAVDFVIRGEGETAMPSLAKALYDKSFPSFVPGICFRQKTGKPHISSPAFVENLDDLCRPALELVKHSHYQRKKRNSSVVVTGRGCPMNCSYCCVGSSHLPYRQKSVQNVLNEIDSAVKTHDIGFIDFEDENLSFDKKWFQSFLQAFLERYASKNIELKAMNGLFPPTLDKETILLMKTAGFKTLNLSLGSTSAKQLKRFNRPDMVESCKDAIHSANRAGLDTVTYLIACAPGQNATDSLDDLFELYKMKTLTGLSLFYPAPGSSDYDRLEKNNLLPAHFSLMRSSALFAPPPNTSLEAATLLRLARLLNFLKTLGKDEIDSVRFPPVKPSFTEPVSNRREIGKYLAAVFFREKKLKGMDKHGKIFEHPASDRILLPFLKRF